MKKMILGISVLFAFLFFGNFFFDTFFFSNSDELYCVPTDGKWYCEEIQCVISFSHIDPISSIVIDGDIVKCEVGNERFTPEVILYCRENNHRSFEFSENIFSGTILEVNDNHFVLQEVQTKAKYIFYRIE